MSSGNKDPLVCFISILQEKGFRDNCFSHLRQLKLDIFSFHIIRNGFDTGRTNNSRVFWVWIRVPSIDKEDRKGFHPRSLSLSHPCASLHLLLLFPFRLFSFSFPCFFPASTLFKTYSLLPHRFPMLHPMPHHMSFLYI